MITDTTMARREMFGMLTTVWDVANWAPVGEKPAIYYDGREKPTVQDQNQPTQPRAEIYMRPAPSGQGSLADPWGKRRWNEIGTLWIKCLGPIASGKGLEVAEYMATIASLAYQGRESEHCIWFRNVRKDYIGEVDGWYQINVLADYYYDELR